MSNLKNSSLSEFFRGKSVTLLGAGISNVAVARAAMESAAEITVRDLKSPDEIGKNAQDLLSMGAKLITGEGYLDNITEELVFRSPGIRPDLVQLKAAVARGSVLTSEMEAFLALRACPVYAVTGSDGKTTTTILTSLMLAQSLGSEHVFLGGNIGAPLLDRADSISSSDAVAVELSSFQLMTLDSDSTPVDVAAITNITPNHLNWHTSMDEYIEAKKNILRSCRRAVLNYDNAETRKIARAVSVPVTYFSLSPIPKGELAGVHSAVWLGEDGMIRSYFPEEGERDIMHRSEIMLPGLHNTANYMTAIGITHGAVDVCGIVNVARTFGGVEHRLEFVRRVGGVTYINGSIDSSPTRTAAALSAITDRPVILIAGGYDKHIPYEPLAEAILGHSTVRAVVLTGDTADAIYRALEAHPSFWSALSEGFSVVKNPDFDGAVFEAGKLARDGEVVLLSPASASFDRFKNFAERGERFKKLVNEI